MLQRELIYRASKVNNAPKECVKNMCEHFATLDSQMPSMTQKIYTSDKL